MHSKQKGTFPTTPRILAAFLMAFFLMVSCGCSTKIGQPVLPDSEGNGSEPRRLTITNPTKTNRAKTNRLPIRKAMF